MNTTRQGDITGYDDAEVVDEKQEEVKYRRKSNSGIDFHRFDVRSVERKQTSNDLTNQVTLG